MALAGRVPEQMPITCAPKPEESCHNHSLEKLQESDLTLLEMAYMEKFPMYAFVCNEYRQEKQRVLNAGRGSLFPSKGTWNPPGRVLSENERKALCGPSHLANIRKKLY